MEKINRFSKKALTPDEVFVFDVILCDNEVDRDYERFTNESLEALKEMFIGKTGIFDHNWSAHGQKARIFDAVVLTDNEKKTMADDSYTYLKASAYMLKTEENRELIAEIQGGIKKEVSVGCSVAKSICSICGNIMGSSECVHTKGREYGGKLCYAELCEPTDAYEWSFVAVPAQKNAGIIKRFGKTEAVSLEKYVENSGVFEFLKRFSELKVLAEAGEKYTRLLKNEVIRLGVLAESGYDKDFLKGLTEKMDTYELEKMKNSFEKKLDELYPPLVQMKNKDTEKKEDNGGFLI